MKFPSLSSIFVFFGLLITAPFSESFSLTDKNPISTLSKPLAITTCKTRINTFSGNCITPSTCDGAVYNNLCPGISKCCVEDDNGTPWVYWRYVSTDDFKNLFPLLSETRRNVLYPWFNKALSTVLSDKKGQKECDIIAAFSAQIGHESVDLSTFEEFASGEAYEGRCKQLGNCYPGDGVKFKGRGAIQVTGRKNYELVSAYLEEDFITKPDLLVMPSYGFQASVWFWMSNNLNQYCTGKLQDFINLTKKINGGVNGLEDRINKWNRAKNAVQC